MAKHLNVNLSFTADTGQAAQQIKSLQQQLQKLVNTTGINQGIGFTKEIQQATQDAANLKIALENATNVKTGKLDLGAFSQQLKASGKNISDYAASLNSLGPEGQKAFASLAQSITMAEVPIKRANTWLTEMGTTIKNAARWQISSSIIHGFMGAVQSAYGYAQNLNESLNNIRIVTGQNTDQMAKFAEQANKTAKSLSTSTLNYTDAALIYYQQGLDDQQVKERTDITVKLANVSRQTTEDVSDQLTAVWNNFDDGSRSLESYVDIMTALGATTASSTEEISTGLEKFAAVADTVGLSFDYAAAALATVTATTRQSADTVGTAFRTLFSRMEGLKLGETLDDGTDLNKYSQAMASIGVNIKDVNGNIKDMDQILDETAEKWQNLSNDQQIALAQTVGGVRQYTNFIALMDNWDFMEENLATAADAEGTLQEQADIYAESWEAARKRVQTAMQSIYQDLLKDDVFISITNGFEKIITAVDNTIDSMGGLKGVLSTIGVLMTTVFGNAISSQIQNMAYNIKLMTKSGRKDIADLRTQANDELVKQMQSQNTPEALASAEVFKAQGELQNQLLAKSDELMAKGTQLTSVEQQRAQIMLDMVNSSGQQVVNLTQQLATQQKIIASQKQSFQGQFRGLTKDKSSLQIDGIDYINPTETFNKQLETYTQQAKISAIFANINDSISESNNNIEEFKAHLLGLMDTTPGLEQALAAIDDKFLDDIRNMSTETDLQNISSKILEQAGVIQNSMETVTRPFLEALWEAAEGNVDKFSTALEKYRVSVETSGTATSRLAASHTVLKKNVDATRESIQKFSGEVKTGTDAILAIGQGFFSLSQVGHTVQGLFDTVGDDSLSMGQKIMSITGSIGMLIPALVQLKKIWGTTFSLLGSSLSGGTLFAIGAAIAFVASAISSWRQSLDANSPDKKLEQTKEQVEKLQASTEKAKSAWQDLSNTMSSYHSAREAIKTLNSDMDEFKENINSANTAALQLISSYSDIVKYRVEQGQVIITNEDEVNEFLKQSELNLQVGSTMQRLIKEQAEFATSFANARIEASKAFDARSNYTIADQKATNYLSFLGRNFFVDPLAAISGPEQQTYRGQGIDKILSQVPDKATLGQLGIEVATAITEAMKTPDGFEEALRNWEPTFDDTWANATETWNKVIDYVLNQDRNTITSDSYIKGLQNIGDINDTRNLFSDVIKPLAKEMMTQYSIADEDIKDSLYTSKVLDTYLDQWDSFYQDTLSNFKDENGSIDYQKIREQFVAMNPFAYELKDNVIIDKETGSAADIDLDTMVAQVVGPITTAAMEAMAKTDIQNLDNIEFGQGGKFNETIAQIVNGKINEIPPEIMNELQTDVNNWEFDIDTLGLFKSLGTTWEDITNQIRNWDITDFRPTPIFDTIISSFKTFKTELDKLELGDEIDSNLFNSLDETLQSFFTKTSDGFYRLTSDADELQSALYNLTLNKLTEEIQTQQNILNNANDRYNTTTTAQNDNFTKLQDFAQAVLNVGGMIGEEGYSLSENWNNQELRDLVTSAFGADKLSELEGLKPNSQEYQEKLDELALAAAQYIQNITDALKIAENDLDNLIDENSDISSINELQGLLDSGKINQETFDNNIDSVTEKEVIANDFDMESFNAYKQALIEEQGLEEESEATKNKLALAQMRLDRATKDITDNIEDYKDGLKKARTDTEKFTDTVKKLRKNYGDMLNINSEDFSDAFVESAENAELLEAAIGGDEKAFNDLQKIASKDIWGNNDFIEDSGIAEMPDEVASTIEQIADIEGIDVGDKVYVNDNLYPALISLYENAYNAVLAGGGSVADAMAMANQMINAVGFDVPEIEMEERTIYLTSRPPDNIVPTAGLTAEGIDGGGSGIFAQGINWSSTPSEAYSYEYTLMVPKGNPSFTKTSERGGGGSAPKTGGGGGGGGGKAQDKKKLEDEQDRYHEIKEVLEDLQRIYDRISTSKDRAFGKRHLDAIDEEKKAIEDLIAAEQKYVDEAQNYAKSDKAKLDSYGYTINYDEFGRISNYNDVIRQAVERFNNSARGEDDDKAYDEFMEWLDRYEESMDTAEEHIETILDYRNDLYDLDLEKVQYAIELKIDFGQDRLDYLDWVLNRIEEDAFNAGDAIANLGEQAGKLQYMINAGRQGINDVLSHAGATASQIDGILNGSIDWNEMANLKLTADDMDAIKEYRDNLMDYTESLWELRQTVFEELTDAWDAWSEKIEYNLDLFEHYESLLEYFNDIVDLLGINMINISREMRQTTQRANFNVQLNQLAAQRKVMEEYRKQEEEYMEHLNEARARGNEYDIRLWESYLNDVQEAAREAEENMMDDWATTLETASDLFDQMVEDVIATYEEQLSGMFGNLEGLQQAFDQQTEITDRYVEDYQKIYDLTKLNRDIQNSIDDTDSIKAKTRLRDLQEEINKLQESNTKMSQYDLDYLRKKYELRLAEIQLEDAQNAKSTVRMSRDSENNWSYVYTANEDAMEDAYQNYEDKLYEMQQLNTEYIKELQNNMLQSQIELADAVRELDRSAYGSDEEYKAALDRLRSYYLGQYDYYADEISKALGNNKTTYDQDWTWYSDLTGYKKSADDEYLDKFEETVYSQITGYRDLEDAQDNFREVTEGMVAGLTQAFQEWQANVELAMQTAGTSTEDFANTMFDSSEKIQDAAADAEDRTVQMAEEMTAALEENMNTVTNWQQTFSEAIEQTIDEIKTLIQYINDLIAAQSGLNANGDVVNVPKEEEPPPVEKQEVVQQETEANPHPYGETVSVTGNSPNRYFKTSKGTFHLTGTYKDNYAGSDEDARIIQQAWDRWARVHGSQSAYKTYGNLDMTKLGFDTGGYTGEWFGGDGRLAFLHQKELVLNEQDTSNMLSAVDVVRNIARMIDLNALTSLAGLSGLSAAAVNAAPQELEQNVHITAEFPNAVDHNEIYQALESLPNMASQFAQRKNK